MQVAFHPDIEPAMDEFKLANELRPLMVYGVPAVQEYPGTLLPDERLFLVYAKPSLACIHTANRFVPATINDTCGFDRIFDIEDVAESLIDRTSLSYDVFRADQWATVYYYDPLLDHMVKKSRSRGGKYEMYEPRSLGESYLGAFDKWKGDLDDEFDADLFFDAVRMLLTSGKLVSEIQSSSETPNLMPLKDLIAESGKEFASVLAKARSRWEKGEDIPASWSDLPDDIAEAIREKRNEQLMILNSVKTKTRAAEPYPKEPLAKLYAEFVFELHDAEKTDAGAKQ